MATSTFNKKIVLDENAARILANELNNNKTYELQTVNVTSPMKKEEFKIWLKSISYKS